MEGWKICHNEFLILAYLFVCEGLWLFLAPGYPGPLPRIRGGGGYLCSFPITSYLGKNNQILKYLLLSGIDYHYVLKETPFSRAFFPFFPRQTPGNTPFPEIWEYACGPFYAFNGGGGGGGGSPHEDQATYLAYTSSKIYYENRVYSIALNYYAKIYSINDIDNHKFDISCPRAFSSNTK